MTYSYDACQRLKEECVTNANGVQLAKYSYGLGKAGERLSDYSVYLLCDTEDDFKVRYVGITNDPWRRKGEHERDKRKMSEKIKMERL